MSFQRFVQYLLSFQFFTFEQFKTALKLTPDQRPEVVSKTLGFAIFTNRNYCLVCFSFAYDCMVCIVNSVTMHTNIRLSMKRHFSLFHRVTPSPAFCPG